MDLPTSSAPIPLTKTEKPSAIGIPENLTSEQDAPLREPIRTDAEAQRGEKESTIRCMCPEGGRNLVVCIDGTSNQFGKKNTHVIELYRLVKKLPGDNQLTYYNSGIGTYAKPSWKSLNYLKQVVDHKIDLAIAWNFETIVLNAYRWLSDKYREGDRIYLFGFSRGAYQVRVLSAMINKVGLIHEGSEEQIPFGNKTPPAGETPASRFKATFSRNVKVHFVGAWDTVSSVGVVRHKVLPDTANGMNHVCYFRHALALDERRVKFLPEYVYQGLSEFEKTEVCPSQSVSSHIKEVWFVGTHSDIGGGNVNNEKMDRRAAALQWMLYEASGRGLKLDNWSVEQEPASEISESLSGIWWFLEVMPIKHLDYKSRNGTSRRSHLGASRCIKDGQTFHSTVLASLNTNYIPKATISWKLSQSHPHSYWRMLQTSRNEQARCIEQDLYDVALEVIKAYNEKVQILRDGQDVSSDEIISDVLRCSRTEEGRQALRENNTVNAVLEAATDIRGKLRPEHLDALLDVTIQIGAGARMVVLSSDVLHLTRMLRERPRWPEFRDQYSIKRDIFVLAGHDKHVVSVALSKDGRRIASGSFDDTVRIWDASTGTALRSSLDGHSDWVRSVAFSPNGTHVVSGSDDHTIRVWNLDTGTTVVGPIEGHTGGVFSVAYSPDGMQIVSGSNDETIRIWDVQTGAAVGEPLSGHQGYVLSVAFSPNGTRVASGSADRTVRIWDVATGAALGSPLTGHGDWVRLVAFSPDGAHVVSGSDDCTIRVWDVQTGTIIVGPITGYTGAVISVAYSPDGTRIVSGSADKTIWIWDAKTGKVIGKPLTGHEGPVRSVAFSSDGKRVVSGSVDCTVRIWDVEDLVVE